MENTPRTSAALIDKANANIAQLLRRFENIVALAPEPSSRAASASESYQVEVETAALVRAAEELTSLTRILKEAWLFGQLNTLGASDGTAEIVEDKATAVADLVEEKLKA